MVIYGPSNDRVTTIARAVTFLQRALNVLNVGGKLYPDLTVDA